MLSDKYEYAKKPAVPFQRSGLDVTTMTVWNHSSILKALLEKTIVPIRSLINANASVRQYEHIG